MENRLFNPYQSFGDIHFGEHYLEVRKKLNAPVEQQYVDNVAKNFYDFFDDLNLKVEYDYDNNVLSIEAYNNGSFDFIFLEQNLNKMSYKEIEELLKTVDEKAAPFSIGIYSPKFGISICSEAFDDENDTRASSFQLVRKDYMTFYK
jgi:Domain of unknown function (DUF4309)